MKNNTKLKLIIAIALIMMIIALCTGVNAATGEAYSVGMSLTSNSKLNAGDTVTVSVNLTSVNAGNGIDTITAELDYDTNVFEAISSSDFTASSGWKAPSYAASSKMLTVQKDSKVKAAETVFTINLKVKNPVNVDSTKISLKDITASGGRVSDGGTGDITVNNASVTISKTKDASSNTEKPTPTPSTTNNTPATNNTVKDTTTTKKTTLPKTGLGQAGVIAIVVVAIIGIFSYALYKKIAKDVK